MDGVPKRKYVRVGKKGAENHTAEEESIGVLMKISNCKIYMWKRAEGNKKGHGGG